MRAPRPASSHPGRIALIALPVLAACASAGPAVSPPPENPAVPRAAIFAGAENITSGIDSLELVVIQGSDTILAGWGIDTVSVDWGTGFIRRVLHLESPVLGGAEHHTTLDSVHGFMPLHYEARTAQRIVAVFFGDTAATITADDRARGTRDSWIQPIGDSVITFPSLELVLRGLEPETGTLIVTGAFYAGWSSIMPVELRVVGQVSVAEIPTEPLWKITGTVAGLPAAYYVGTTSRRVWYWWWDTARGPLWVRAAHLRGLPD